MENNFADEQLKVQSIWWKEYVHFQTWRQLLNPHWMINAIREIALQE